ncbi:MAG: hypothetical protein D6797_06340 [Bdellovibrio sp.]|nr:MAG: hypothetical protein D6797_06340 [Bdellovibrio sp.]
MLMLVILVLSGKDMQLVIMVALATPWASQPKIVVVAVQCNAVITLLTISMLLAQKACPAEEFLMHVIPA